MKKLVQKYINNEIVDEEKLAKLRDDAEFMLEVFRTKMKAIEFDNASDRLKADEDFVQRTKDIFSSDRDEFFSLAISLRNYRKKKEANNDKLVVEESKKENVNEPDEKREETVKIERSKSSFKKVPIKVKDVRPGLEKKEKMEKAKSVEEPKKEVIDEEDTFSFLVRRLPISRIEQKLLVERYSTVSEEKKILSTLMVMDFLDQQENNRPKSVRLLRSNNNKFYPHY